VLHIRLPFARPSGNAVAEDPVSAGTADPADGYLAGLLADTKAELARVDSKAALLLAASGVVIGALLAGLLNGRWAPSGLSIEIQWLWWLGVASAAAGLLSITAAVYPRIHKKRIPGVPAYYGDVAAYDDVEAFRHAIARVSRVAERQVDQVFILSHVVQCKYTLLRRGMRCLLLAISACTVAVVVNILLGH
jgi:hypothetical protein